MSFGFQTKVSGLKEDVKRRDERICNLESEVSQLHDRLDDLEQYSRRNSLRITGIEESPDEVVGTKVLHLVNEVLDLTPPLQASDIDRCHRAGPPTNRQGTPQMRAVLIKFTSYASRARVMSLRPRLRALYQGKPFDDIPNPWATSGRKRTVGAEAAQASLSKEQTLPEPDTVQAGANPGEGMSEVTRQQYKGKSIFFNEDLTKARALLARDARQAKKAQKIRNTWSFDGRIMIKDNHNVIKSIKSINELPA